MTVNQLCCDNGMSYGIENSGHRQDREEPNSSSKGNKNVSTDTNGAALTMLAHHRPSVNRERCMNPNSTHQERDSGSQYLVPQPGISGLASIPCVNVASENIYIGGQPLPYPGLGNSEPQNVTTNDTGANDGLYSSSGGFGILQDKQQRPMSISNHGIRSDRSIISVENNLYENVMAPNASSHTVTGDMHLFLDEPFYGEPDKLVDNSFGSLPLDFIRISSTDLIPDLGDILQDDDLMEYDVPVAAGGVVPTPNGRHLINLRSGGWDPRVTLRGRGNFVIYGVRGV
ncbi:hypothetical protein C4D60_Mb03t10530 [Musa balbisiana]|uniref:Uncharacterized protein n=1 Tax=Musa balbisiana TaxID=52838 RepID=A0A4S8J913_MUSBA|nr:hypothetical protein C4D60_Mb03t10530 [Musa balbisiana]